MRAAMEKKLFYDRRTAKREDGTQMRLSYYLLQDKNDYGIAVELEGEHEEAAISHISVSRQWTKELLACLSRNTVTPCTLREVVSDALNKI